MTMDTYRRLTTKVIEGQPDGKNDLRVIFGPDGKILRDNRKGSSK